MTATAVTDANGVAATTITLGPISCRARLPDDLVRGRRVLQARIPHRSVTIYLSTSFVIWGGNDAGLKLGQRVHSGLPVGNPGAAGRVPHEPALQGPRRPDLSDPPLPAERHVAGPDADVLGLQKGGQTWPPPISVPAYIEVIVSTVIAKQGTDIYGNIAAAAVEKVDPQPPYGPDPGKPGFGVIVAVIEDTDIFPAPARLAASQTQPQTVLPNEQITISATVSNPSTATAATDAILYRDARRPFAGHGLRDARHDQPGRQPHGRIPRRHTGYPGTREQREPSGLHPRLTSLERPRLHGRRAGDVHRSERPGLPPRRGVVAEHPDDPGADARALRSRGRQPRLAHPYKVTVTNIGSAPATATST